MKKCLLFLILILGWLEFVSGQEVIYGNVETDGYQKVTKGAMWSKRPEAKAVYNGENPPGVEVITLLSDCFVRFAKNEHNPLDINYIVFPKGEKVYKKGDDYFAAICGNKIIYIKSVDAVIVKSDIVFSDLQKKQVITDDKKDPIDYGGGKLVAESAKAEQPSIPIEIPKEKKKFFKRKGVKIGGIVILAGGVEELIRNFLVPIIFHKTEVVNQAHMSGGFGDEETNTNTTTTTTTTTNPGTGGSNNGGFGD